MLIPLLIVVEASAQARRDSSRRRDTLRYPLYDRYGDPIGARRSHAFDFRDTGFLRKRIEYDPRSGEYIFRETVGDRLYRPSAAFSPEEFRQWQGRKDESDYFRKRADLLFSMNRKIDTPPCLNAQDETEDLIST
jgi:hypothetical protein